MAPDRHTVRGLTERITSDANLMDQFRVIPTETIQAISPPAVSMTSREMEKTVKRIRRRLLRKGRYSTSYPPMKRMTFIDVG